MSIYLFPVKGLLASVDLDLAIGGVRLLGPDRAKVQLRHAAHLSSLPENLRGDFDEFEAEPGSCVAARVEAEDKDVAVDLVEAALDVLRVFLYTRARAKMPTFGMTDGVLGGAVQCADLGSGGLGWFRIGHCTDVHITEDSALAYVESTFAAIAGAAIGAPDPTHNQVKALTAIRLASRALLTHDPATQNSPKDDRSRSPSVRAKGRVQDLPPRPTLRVPPLWPARERAVRSRPRLLPHPHC